MGNLFCEVLRATLCDTDLTTVTNEEWQLCYDNALRQQVLAMMFPVVSSLPKEQRPPFELWSRWMAYTQHTAARSRHKQEVVKKIGKWLAEDGLTTTIIKGFSLASLYPQPELRECGDIDIYSAGGYEAVNVCLAKHGLTIGKADGHHCHITIDGESVEHHFSFGNSRTQDVKEEMEETLRRLVTTASRPTAMPGIVFPNATFTALYTGWHAYKHFLSEKIVLRHVIDWALALKALSAEEAESVCVAKEKGRWGRFADTMTAIALHRICLPMEWFPQHEVVRASTIAPEMEQRVWDDMMETSRTAKGRSANHKRLNIACRLILNRWKFDAFADESAWSYLWMEFAGWMRAANQ